MSENINKNHPIAIPVHTSEPTTTTTNTSNSISIEEPTLYEINPRHHLEQMEHDMNLRALQMTMMENEIEDFLKVEIYGRGKMIKFLTMIDFFFLTVNAFASFMMQNYYFLFLGLCPLCICGYYGAKNYNKNSLLGYVFYLFLMNVYYFMLFMYFNNFFLFIFCLLESYFLFYTFRLYHCLGRAKEETIESLRDGWVPISVLVYYY